MAAIQHAVWIGSSSYTIPEFEGSEEFLCHILEMQNFLSDLTFEVRKETLQKYREKYPKLTNYYFDKCGSISSYALMSSIW